MSLGLIGVFYAISRIQKNGINPSLLFIDKPAPITSGKMNLCRNRISSIDLELGRGLYKVYQEKTQWFFRHVGDEPIEYPPPQMEKWLADFCTLHIDYFMEDPTELPPRTSESLTLHYIDGTNLALPLRGPWVEWNGNWVKSSELSDAIRRLLPTSSDESP
jgi:hypothetical protein